MGTPAMKSRFPSLIRDLLKKRDIPRRVNTAPEPRRARPAFLFPPRRESGTAFARADNGDPVFPVVDEEEEEDEGLDVSR